MTDSPDPDPLAFAPVSVRARRGGWTPDRQRKFIQALAAIGVVAAAARAVGKSATAAYALRERAGADSLQAHGTSRCRWRRIARSRPPWTVR